MLVYVLIAVWAYWFYSVWVNSSPALAVLGSFYMYLIGLVAYWSTTHSVVDSIFNNVLEMVL